MKKVAILLTNKSTVQKQILAGVRSIHTYTGEHTVSLRLFETGTLKTANTQSVLEKITEYAPDVLVTIGNSCSLIAKKWFSGKPHPPIVFACSEDPIKLKLLNSAEAPTENITGVFDKGPLEKQALSTIIKLNPHISRFVFVYQTTKDNKDRIEYEISRMAQNATLENRTVLRVSLDANPAQELQSILKEGDGVIVPTSSLPASHLPILSSACKEKLAFLFDGSKKVLPSSALAGYASDFAFMGHKVAQYVYKILFENIPVSKLPVCALEKSRALLGNDTTITRGVSSSSNHFMFTLDDGHDSRLLPRCNYHVLLPGPYSLYTSLAEKLESKVYRYNKNTSLSPSVIYADHRSKSITTDQVTYCIEDPSDLVVVASVPLAYQLQNEMLKQKRFKNMLIINWNDEHCHNEPALFSNEWPSHVIISRLTISSITGRHLTKVLHVLVPHAQKIAFIHSCNPNSLPPRLRNIVDSAQLYCEQNGLKFVTNGTDSSEMSKANIESLIEGCQIVIALPEYTTNKDADLLGRLCYMHNCFYFGDDPVSPSSTTAGAASIRNISDFLKEARSFIFEAANGKTIPKSLNLACRTSESNNLLINSNLLPRCSISEIPPEVKKQKVAILLLNRDKVQEQILTGVESIGRLIKESLVEVRLFEIGSLSNTNIQAALNEIHRYTPDALVTIGGVCSVSAKDFFTQQAKSPHIVFVGTSDPVELGLVDNMEKREESITGVIAKQPKEETPLQLLLELNRKIQRFIFPYRTAYDPNHIEREIKKMSTYASNKRCASVKVRLGSNPNKQLRAILQEGDAVIVSNGSIHPTDLTPLDKACKEKGVMLFGDVDNIIPPSAIASYASDLEFMGRKAALYVHEILYQNVPPGDLPVHVFENASKIVIDNNTMITHGISLPRDDFMFTLDDGRESRFWLRLGYHVLMPHPYSFCTRLAEGLQNRVRSAGEDFLLSPILLYADRDSKGITADQVEYCVEDTSSLVVAVGMAMAVRLQHEMLRQKRFKNILIISWSDEYGYEEPALTSSEWPAHAVISRLVIPSVAGNRLVKVLQALMPRMQRVVFMHSCNPDALPPRLQNMINNAQRYCQRKGLELVVSGADSPDLFKEHAKAFIDDCQAIIALPEFITDADASFLGRLCYAHARFYLGGDCASFYNVTATIIRNLDALLDAGIPFIAEAAYGKTTPQAFVLTSKLTEYNGLLINANLMPRCSSVEIQPHVKELLDFAIIREPETNIDNDGPGGGRLTLDGILKFPHVQEVTAPKGSSQEPQGEEASEGSYNPFLIPVVV